MHGLILFVDLTNSGCFEHLIDQVDNIKRWANDSTKLLLVGSKSDDLTRRQIPFEEVKQFADKEGFPYIETSARKNRNVTEAMNMIVMAIERDFDTIDGEIRKRQGTPHKAAAPQITSNKRERCLVRTAHLRAKENAAHKLNV